MYSCAPTGMNADHGIDPANKELYLSDDDFLTAFAMDKDSFKVSLHGATQHLAPGTKLLVFPPSRFQ